MEDIEPKEPETLEPETEETTKESEVDEDTEAEKPRMTPEQERAIKQRNFKKLAKELGVELEKPKVENKKSDEFDDGQLAYLAVEGIKSDEDLEWTKGMQKKLGLTLRELVNDDYFTTKLKSRKDTRDSLDASPSTTRRTSNRPTDKIDVEYANYQKTGKLPADREMAQKVIAKRLKQETGSGNNFTSNPVVGNY